MLVPPHYLCWGHLRQRGHVPSFLEVSWGVLQEVEDIAAPWGCERFLGGGKGQVAWEIGPVGVCCCLLLCPWSKSGYLGGAWEGKRPQRVQAVVQSGELAGGRAI